MIFFSFKLTHSVRGVHYSKISSLSFTSIRLDKTFGTQVAIFHSNDLACVIISVTNDLDLFPVMKINFTKCLSLLIWFIWYSRGITDGDRFLRFKIKDFVISWTIEDHLKTNCMVVSVLEILVFWCPRNL